MGNVWRNGRIVGTAELYHGDDDEPFGFGVVTSKYKGVGQSLLEVSDLKTVDLSATSLVLGEDKRVYEERHGLIECLAPARTVGDDPSVYVSDVNWASFPPAGELAWLFYNFFSQYKDREVVMLMGRRRDGNGHSYHVPEQVGTCGGVKWDADNEEMGEFQDRAGWIGTLHSHPGSCCGASQTDIDDWANPEKSGLHVIFGRDGSYTVNGAIAERTFQLFRGDLSGIVGTPAVYSTSKGRSLVELLKKPRPIVVKRSVSRGAIVEVQTTKRPYVCPWDSLVDDDFVEEALEVLGVLPVDQENGVAVVHIVWYNGRNYIMTSHQYGELIEWCRGVCPVPKSKRMRISNMRGGMR